VEARTVTDDARSEVLDAACSAAKQALQFVAGGPVVSEQDGDDPQTRELILAEGHMYRVRVEFEAL
jgi:hypothetical protein